MAIVQELVVGLRRLPHLVLPQHRERKLSYQADTRS